MGIDKYTLATRRPARAAFGSSGGSWFRLRHIHTRTVSCFSPTQPWLPTPTVSLFLQPSRLTMKIALHAVSLLMLCASIMASVTGSPVLGSSYPGPGSSWRPEIPRDVILPPRTVPPTRSYTSYNNAYHTARIMRLIFGIVFASLALCGFCAWCCSKAQDEANQHASPPTTPNQPQNATVEPQASRKHEPDPWDLEDEPSSKSGPSNLAVKLATDDHSADASDDETKASDGSDTEAQNSGSDERSDKEAQKSETEGN